MATRTGYCVFDPIPIFLTPQATWLPFAWTQQDDPGTVGARPLRNGKRLVVTAASQGQQAKERWANGNGRKPQEAAESHVGAVTEPEPTETPDRYCQEHETPFKRHSRGENVMYGGATRPAMGSGVGRSGPSQPNHYREPLGPPPGAICRGQGATIRVPRETVLGGSMPPICAKKARHVPPIGLVGASTEALDGNSGSS